MKPLVIAALALAGLTTFAFAQQPMQQPPERPPPDARGDPAVTHAQRPMFTIEHGTTGQRSNDREDYDARFDPTAREPRRNQPGIELFDDMTE